MFPSHTRGGSPQLPTVRPSRFWSEKDKESRDLKQWKSFAETHSTRSSSRHNTQQHLESTNHAPSISLTIAPLFPQPALTSFNGFFETTHTITQGTAWAHSKMAPLAWLLCTWCWTMPQLASQAHWPLHYSYSTRSVGSFLHCPTPMLACPGHALVSSIY